MDEPDPAAPEPVGPKSTHDAVLRVRLAALPRVPLSSGAPGMVAFLRRDVLHAGLDPLEVSLWVRDRGGHEGTAYVTGATRPDRLNETVRAPLHPEPYFGVAASSLAADDDLSA